MKQKEKWTKKQFEMHIKSNLFIKHEKIKVMSDVSNKKGYK